MQDDVILIQGEVFHRKDIERIRRFRLLDDTFFTVCFEDSGECAELVLRILLDKDDLRVVQNKTQYSIKNLHGHSVVLDVLAVDSAGLIYDIEMQRTDKGATPKRARYNSSLIDGHALMRGEDYEKLPETYVIFITEDDYFGSGLPFYSVERTVTQTGVLFGDGAHVMYVNAGFVDDSRLGKLMHDFNCIDPNEMNYPVLAERTRYFKENVKGVRNMCRIMEEVQEESFERGREEGRAEGRAEGRMEGREEGRVEGRAEGREEGRAEGRMEGREEGRAEGRVEGREEGRAEERKKAKEAAKRRAISMLKDGISLEKTSEYVDIPLTEVKKLADSVFL